MLLGMNFDQINQETIQALIAAGATESVHLDFKRATYGKLDGDKKELLKDISSFANSLGGHLVIGVDEEEGAASAIVALENVGVEQELLRLEQIVRAGIEPTIVGLRIKRVPVGDGDVIVIQVPRSFNPPHRVIFKGSNRYHARNSSGVYELSLEELRRLFGQQRSIEERATAFVGQRFLKIQANDGPLAMPIEEGGIVVHMIPLPDFGANRRIDVSLLRENRNAFSPIGTDGHSGRVNLDGFVVYRSGQPCRGYTQVFRDGSVEATSASVFTSDVRPRTFASRSLPERIISSLSLYMGGMQAIDVSPPIQLQISFFGTNGLQIGLSTRHMHMFDSPPPYDREELHLPPTVISDYYEDNNYESVVVDQMNFLWNVFGFDRCFNFDENGRWRPES